jgi:hypothetical protein
MPVIPNFSSSTLIGDDLWHLLEISNKLDTYNKIALRVVK